MARSEPPLASCSPFRKPLIGEAPAPQKRGDRTVSALLLGVLVAMILAACGAGSRTPERAQRGEGTVTSDDAVVMYRCADGFPFSITIGQREARLLVADTTVALDRVASESGARYQAGRYVFRQQGDAASLEVGRETYTECRPEGGDSPWVQAEQRGVSFRAVGNEPGWAMEVLPGRGVTLVLDYGERNLDFGPEAAERFVSEGRTTLSAGGPEASVEVTDQPCTDSMNGARFRFTVALTVDQRTYNGCGRRLR